MATQQSISEDLEIPKVKPNPLEPRRLTFADAKSVHHIAIIPANTPVEFLTESGFWSSCHHRLNPLDRITVHTDSLEYMAELLVLEASPTYCSIHLLQVHKLPGLIGDDSEDLVAYDIGFSQFDGGYFVRRVADDVTIIKGASSYSAAVDALKSHPSFKG
jgi:hypothetical protein